ncbi:hypothetical protein HO173_001257 [Letharia columbiana]|uniref:Uncharacterized protein n=1 Tax=Letharia columbiana TaxID=112416 RepID=A0A8H6G4X1_9LECA|nr:uncharacterized protein HO173_001257 [Letharia columbiana]KAF6240586.1 hypothetical protein HO173_001257 [Letharia columbiana]
MKANVYRLNYEKKNNDMALKENNSNEEPTTGAVAIQIVLAMSTCLPTIAYRISHNDGTADQTATNAMAS